MCVKCVAMQPTLTFNYVQHIICKPDNVCTLQLSHEAHSYNILESRCALQRHAICSRHMVVDWFGKLLRCNEVPVFMLGVCQHISDT